MAKGRNVNDGLEEEPGVPSPGWSDLLSLGLKAGGNWSPAELEAALSEQMATPVQVELAGLPEKEAHTMRAEAQQNALVLKSWRDLYLHPHPPVELLVIGKNYFKANIYRPQPGLPSEVARALYYLAVAAAWTHNRTRISGLNNTELLQAMQWILDQQWITAELKELASNAAESLSSANGKA